MAEGEQPQGGPGRAGSGRGGAAPRWPRRAVLALPLLAGVGLMGGRLPTVASAEPGGRLRAASLAGGGLSPAVQERLPAAMREAIAEARQARFAFGAVLLDRDSGEPVFRAHNTSEGGDPTAHGEVNALRGAGLAGLDLTRTVLVSTAEPCPMCGAAAVWARVAGVVYGTSIATLIRFGWGQIDLPLLDVVSRSTFWTMPIVGGYLTAETDPLYAGGPPAG
jgi:tRNA(Arg) A34 adenosine deaminase TadA